MDTLNQLQQSPQPVVEQTPVPPKPSVNSKTLFVAVVVFIVIMIGLITYILAARTKPTTQPPTISPTLSQPSPTPDPTANWKTYINMKYRYSVKYPDDWESHEYTSEGKFEKIATDSQWIKLSPQIKPCPPNVNPFTCEQSEAVFIFVYENPLNLSIEEFNKKRQLERGIDLDKSKFKINYTPVQIGGTEGLRTFDYWKIPPYASTASDDIFVKKGGHIYQISYDKLNVEKKISMQTFDQILSTFQFSN